MSCEYDSSQDYKIALPFQLYVWLCNQEYLFGLIAKRSSSITISILCFTGKNCYIVESIPRRAEIP